MATHHCSSTNKLCKKCGKKTYKGYLYCTECKYEIEKPIKQIICIDCKCLVSVKNLNKKRCNSCEKKANFERRKIRYGKIKNSLSLIRQEKNKRSCNSCGVSVGKGKQLCLKCKQDRRNEWQKAYNKKQVKRPDSIICAFCGKERSLEGYHGGTIPMYCSDKCKQKAKRKNNPVIYNQGSFNVVYFRKCENCGKSFVGRTALTKWCSNECREVIEKINNSLKSFERSLNEHKNNNKVKKCSVCGVLFSPLYGLNVKLICSDECAKISNKVSSRFSKEKRRIRFKETNIERFNPNDIYDRDKWKCKLCGKKVDRDLKYPHPKSASLDHIIPISKGGAHCRANVQLAHLVCNVKKGNKSNGEQLLLIG